jgi:hypothetical protein
MNPQQKRSPLGTSTDLAGPLCPAGANRWFVDRILLIVLLVWATCWLSYAIYLQRYGTPLPFCDEWNMVPIAAGKAPITLQWLWQPENEHRAPLTRLAVVLLGRLGSWDLRLARQVNLALLAVSSVCLMLAARAVRGRVALSDAFLCLLVLTPFQYQTLLLYAYAYGMALAWLCLAVSAVMTGWPLRSRRNLWLFLALALVVTLSGGPAGNLWAIGLCAGVALRGGLEGQSGGWKRHALGGTAVVIAASVALLLLAPTVRRHASFCSDSLPTTVRALCRLAVCWLGRPALEATYPWAALVLAVPGVYLLGRIVQEVRRTGKSVALPHTRLSTWVDLTAVLLAAGAAAGLIALGRGNYPNLWDSRYATLLLPIGVVTYLLLVRFRARVLPGALALVVAGCVVWSWPDAIQFGRSWHGSAEAMVHVLRKGEEPLSVVAMRYADAMYCGGKSAPLLDGLVLLREQGLSAFRKHNRGALPGMGPPQVWEAEVGRLTGGFRPVADDLATKNLAVQAVATEGGPATAAYDVDVQADGSYLLCCRLWASTPGQVLAVRVDGAPPREQSVPVSLGYLAINFEPLLDLRAGKHVLTLTLPNAGTKLDVLELVPRAAGLSEERGVRKVEAKHG